MLPAMIDTDNPQLLWLGLALCMAGINLLTFAAFHLDKERARTGGWRVSERGLLLLAASGGWPAAKFAQHQLNHKRRKRSFSTRLNMIGIGLGVFTLLGLTPVGAGLVA